MASTSSGVLHVPGMGNLFNDLPTQPQAEEQFTALLQSPHVLIEKIVSTGQRTPAGQWLSQARAEWVLLLSGSATLRFEVKDQQIEMVPGDFVLIEPNARHRVEATDQEQPTVWLAIHCSSGENPVEQAS